MMKQTPIENASGPIGELLQMLKTYSPPRTDGVLLAAYCDDIVSSYQLYTRQGSLYTRQDPDLPGDPTNLIRQAYKNRNDRWTGFLLFLSPEGTAWAEYCQDLNPLLDAGQALDWLVYDRLGIEPESDWDQKRLAKALKAESFKKTLAYACMTNDPEEVVRRLSGVNERELERKVPGYGTPLHIACAQRNLEMVKLLVEAGADRDKRHNRQTPLEKAYKQGDLAIIDYLARIDPQANAELLRSGGLFLVVNIRDASLIASVIQYGADVNQRNSKAAGLTPLHLAAYADNEIAVGTLIRYGADPSIEEVYHRTPLHYACQFGKESAVRAFLESGVDPAKPNSEGMTSIDLARQYDQIKIVGLLETAIQPKD